MSDLNESTTITMRHPRPSDGRALWHMTAESKVLDLNSTYAYVLWSADFAETSVIAERAGIPVGFITGYRRPQESGTLMVWQVAVDAAERGKGVGVAMLNWLVSAVSRPGEQLVLETTVSPSNIASRSMFESFARGVNLKPDYFAGFPAELFPEQHEAEPLLRIGPLPRRQAPN